MADFAIKVTLINGETRVLSDSHAGSIEAAQDRYSDFVNRAGNLGGDWLNT